MLSIALFVRSVTSKRFSVDDLFNLKKINKNNEI